MVCKTMMATSPWPHDLEDLCSRLCYRGWGFALETGDHDGGLVTSTRLVITTYGEKCGYTGRPRPVHFYFPIPACTFDRGSWTRWLYDRVMDVHAHENGEHFAVVYERPTTEPGVSVHVAERPFAPLHGPGRDPHRRYEAGIPYSELRVAQDGSKYPGLWWDGAHVHTDDEHGLGPTCLAGRCVPVRLVPDGQ